MRKSKYPDKIDSFGKEICKARLDKGMTLSDVANSVGITDSYLSRIETCNRVPRDNIKRLLADLLFVHTEIFGKYVEKSRKSINLTAEDLAKAVGIDRTYISKIENEWSIPSYEITKKIAKALGDDYIISLYVEAITNKEYSLFSYTNLSLVPIEELLAEVRRRVK